MRCVKFDATIYSPLFLPKAACKGGLVNEAICCRRDKCNLRREEKEERIRHKDYELLASDGNVPSDAWGMGRWREKKTGGPFNNRMVEVPNALKGPSL